MLDLRPVVLKLGGSVLRDEDSLRLAVHEIYRWRRAGCPVVAVVSAFAGKTDALVTRSRAVCADPDPFATAALLATGENEAATALAGALDRAGVPPCILSPVRELNAVGPPLDATPVAFDSRASRAALARGEVVVVPGFVAADPEGRTVLLGRGGSDLTALFVAHALGARRCRLVKDVDGLYERDPASTGPAPRRFARATWEDALATDGSILQRKAVTFARERGLEFELGRVNGTQPTIVGASPGAWAAAVSRPPLRVVLAGLGTVGGGVCELVDGHPELELAAVLVRDAQRPRNAPLDARRLVEHADDALLERADVLIDATGDTATMLPLVERALRTGCDVVTANKELLALHGARLAHLAASVGRRLSGSAAAGGGAPLLEALAGLAGEGVPIRRVRALLNGTANFVLERIAAEDSEAHALEQARRAGFAEADPWRDLSGLDAAHKLCLVARAIGRDDVGLARIRRGAWDPERGRRQAGVKQVATLSAEGDGHVGLEALAADDPLAAIGGEWSAAVAEVEDGRRVLVRGRGAGRWPTAESILGDVLELARDRSTCEAEVALC